jgi:hypothetical protein
MLPYLLPVAHAQIRPDYNTICTWLVWSVGSQALPNGTMAGQSASVVRRSAVWNYSPLCLENLNVK